MTKGLLTSIEKDKYVSKRKKSNFELLGVLFADL